MIISDQAMAMFREIGCDQNILLCFQLQTQGWQHQRRSELFFVDRFIYDHFHVHFYQDGKAEDIHKYRFSQPELSSIEDMADIHRELCHALAC